LGGAACLAAAVLLGFTAQRGGTWLDYATLKAAEQFLSPRDQLVRVLSSESGWPHSSYLTALLPVAVTLLFLAGSGRQHGMSSVFRRWRWVLLTLIAIPVHYVVRVAFRRPGPEDVGHEGIVLGAYPSGAALGVCLGWTLLVVVAGELRPRWRPWLLLAAVVILLVHGIVRALTQKHWPTDILGSYLLVTGAFLLAGSVAGGGARPGHRSATTLSQ
jgi:membrane-associated phospholipid phosphatase